jgi:RHS repeat-associated protein
MRNHIGMTSSAHLHQNLRGLRQLARAVLCVFLLVVCSGVPFITAASNPVRSGQSLTLLPNGQILLAGGYNATRSPTAQLALADTSGNIKTLPFTMQYARAGHTATVLPDGRVLIFGGYGSDGKIVQTAEMLDPSTWTVSTVPSMRLLPRAFHTATVLTDGTLLVIGGVGSAGQLSNDVQVWDYRTGITLAYDAPLSVPRQQHTATLLSSGNVQVSGGIDAYGKTVESSEEYDIDRHNFSVASSNATTSTSPAVADSIPANGGTNVQITAIVGVRFEGPMAVTTLTPSQISLHDGSGNEVPASITGAESGRLVFVVPASPLQFGTTYLLTLDGVLDSNNQALGLKTIQFTTQGNPQDSSDEEWLPGPDAFNGHWSTGTGTSEWQMLPPLQAPIGITALSGQVLRINGRPLAHVLLAVDGQHAFSDSTGRFLITNIHAGYHAMLIDGRTANRPGVDYGLYEAGVKLAAGKTTILNYTIWMTQLDMRHAVNIPVPTIAEETVITNPLLPGLEFRLPKGTTITDHDGHVVHQLTITPIPLDKPPFPLPTGVQVEIYFTIQPGGAYISVAGAPKDKGARLIYPNSFHYQPGTPFDFWNYDPDSKGWYIYGLGRADKTGTTIVPDPGVYVYELTGAMVGDASPPVPMDPTPCPCDGDPVHLSTGEYIYQKTDLSLPDLIPLTLTRTYRTNDSVSRAFGIGATDNYDIFMTGNTNPYTYQELILPDGNRIRFDRISAGTSYTGAVYLHSEAQDGYYGATLTYDTSNNFGASWVLQKKDGTQIWFADSFTKPNPRAAAPVHINDRYGNGLSFQRDNNYNLLQITSPNGRYINFTYDASNRITQATDNIGRSVYYTYDSSGRLYKVQDANGGVTTFTYDGNNNMLTVTDPRQVVQTTNQYDSSGRVIQQTLANQGTYLFSWTPTQNTAQTFGSGGSAAPPYQGGAVLAFRSCSNCSEGYLPVVAQVDVTDPRGYVRSVIFDASGNMTTDIHALNQPEQQTFTYVHNADNTDQSFTNPLGHQTVYTFDANLNLTQLKQLAETNSPVITSYSYDPNFSQLTSVTDPLGHATTFTVDSNGNTTQITDPLNHTTSFTYNSDGTTATITDAMQDSVQFGYSSGDLFSIIDPMGNKTSRFVDWGGRLLAVTDPLGHQTQYQYDNLNQITQVIDPVGNQTALTYDPNGNVLTVTDALQHTTTYTYDGMNRVATRSDPLQRQESYSYDLNGNLSNFTDRKNQITAYTYDGINRVTTVGFGAQNGQYASTINYQYDAGNRVTQAVDSISGTITRGYDGLDRLTSEATPLGSISYNYDAAGRRSTMQVNGQPQVTYTFDNANRLTQIVQGSNTVGFSYDNASRRSTLTLPNGIVGTYSYDQDSHLTGISYALSSNSVGNLVYGYDVLGRRISVSGSMAATGFPPAVSSAAHDAANELTNWGGSTISYDANGNMTSDSVHSYTWDTRNHLSAIDSGNTATFVYDPFGRRVSKSILSTGANFLYDFANPVQELSGTTPTANLIENGVDEYFQRTDAVGTRDFLTDALGSTLALSNSSGVMQTQYGYDPYGNTTASGAGSTNSFQYTGRENDGTGLYFYRARYYDPLIARFAAEDLLRVRGGIDFYTYVAGRPTNAKDPTGLVIWLCTRPAFGTDAPFNSGPNHSFLYNPDNGDNCGMMNGPRSENLRNPNIVCTEVQGSNGLEDNIMNCCHKKAASRDWSWFTWRPGWHDCQNLSDDCITGAGLKNPGPPGGRMGCRGGCFSGPSPRDF